MWQLEIYLIGGGMVRLTGVLIEMKAINDRLMEGKAVDSMVGEIRYSFHSASVAYTRLGKEPIGA